ncbi:hypothetical protein F4803DRAFT_31293 [Xylaria telfairii]|nr:hypothetical protein F4803DRAFT_31293 [Xylaria telfairii]
MTLSYGESSSARSWDLWYRDIGYLAPLDESNIELLKIAEFEDPEMDRINPQETEQFQCGLDDRNVSLEPSCDPFLPDIKELTSVAAQETQRKMARRNRAWKLDLEKSQKDIKFFKRTIMMSMIDRNRLIYASGTDKRPAFDLALESLWKCPPMPTRVSRSEQDTHFLTRPMPELAVAFRRDYLFPEHWDILPPALRNIICYEDTTRAFHFMAVEGTTSCEYAEDTALFQCLNSASQSLHNLYEFFREAGEEHVNVFFRQVRFFSAVVTPQSIKIRVHRACGARGHRGRENTEPDDQPAEMDPIFADYPLQFEYDDYFEASGIEFTRSNVVAAFEQILHGYGIQILLECLRKARDAVVEKCRNYFEKHSKLLPRVAGFYSHGQAPPPAIYNTNLEQQKDLEYIDTMTEHLHGRPRRPCPDYLIPDIQKAKKSKRHKDRKTSKRSRRSSSAERSLREKLDLTDTTEEDEEEEENEKKKGKRKEKKRKRQTPSVSFREKLDLTDTPEEDEEEDEKEKKKEKRRKKQRLSA